MSQPEALFPQSYSAGFDAGYGKHQTAPHKLHSVSILPFFIFVPDTVLKVRRHSTPPGGPCWKQQSHSPAVEYTFLGLASLFR